jgi:K+-sensing histidine kinase KdpD
MSSCLSPKEALEAAAAKVMEHFSFKAARMYLMDKNGRSLSLVASQGVDTTGLEHVKISEGFTGKAARTRSFIAQNVSDLEEQKRAAMLLSKGFKVVVCVPLIYMDKVLGVMNLGADRNLRLSKAKIDLLVAVGNAIAVAVNHSRLCDELARNVKELEEKNETIEFFTYTASHDIKSPLVGIYGLAKLLARQYANVLDERGKSYCGQILKASEQVVALVEGINTYVKSKEALPHLEKVRVKEIVESVRNEFADTLSRRRIRWSQPETLQEVVADRLGMQRIFRNLVENALKYGGEVLS